MENKENHSLLFIAIKADAFHLVLEQVLCQGPSGYLLYHQVIVLLVDTERQS